MLLRPSSALCLVLLAQVLGLAACKPAGGGADAGPTVDGGLPELPDTDGDTIADDHEGKPTDDDTDGDGTADYLDDDSDDDGIPDYREAGDDLTGTPPIDSDGDGTADFRDQDSDDNGIPDGIDGTDDLDSDEIGNFADLDDDGDGISDVMEIGPSPMMPLDSDGDGVHDYQDIDSDDDTIMDAHEGAVDQDLDDVPAYLDPDADGDCRADALEAGDTDLYTPPIDSDDDGGPDFLDLDADNDGLTDTSEDKNCNGALDPGESSPTTGDTDGDGISDLVEVAAGTDPTDPADNPAANGDFVFVVPYLEPPDPLEDTLDFSTDISQADVVFAMDTTGSMGGEINNLKSSVVSLIGTIRAGIPNTGFGVAEYRDFPTEFYGSPGDQPFVLRHRVLTTNTAAGLASVQAAVNTYSAAGGADGPESGFEMLYQAATGAGVSVGSASVPAFSPATAPPASIPAGEEVGTLGGVGFRAGSLPILIFMTDAPSHNSDVGTADNYSFTGAARTADAVTALLGLSARVIGVVSNDAYIADARAQALEVVNQTGARVPPSAWGPIGVRPAGCAESLCCTGLNGDGEATDGTGQCPLLFRVNGNGTGVGDAVAKAVEVLTSYGVFDIGTDPQDDPTDAVDAVAAFVERIEANPTAGPPCASGLTAIDTDGDAVADTFQSVTPGTVVCFDVVPKMNTTVPALDTPQMFKATIVVEGDGVTTLDTRDVFFLVPPVIVDVPVD
jgi:hypothetical protein